MVRSQGAEIVGQVFKLEVERNSSDLSKDFMKF